MFLNVSSHLQHLSPRFHKYNKDIQTILKFIWKLVDAAICNLAHFWILIIWYFLLHILGTEYNNNAKYFRDDSPVHCILFWLTAIRSVQLSCLLYLKEILEPVTTMSHPRANLFIKFSFGVLHNYSCNGWVVKFTFWVK